MADQSRSSLNRSRRRRFSEINHSFREHYHFRPRVPFILFHDHLQRTRLLFSNTVPIIGGYSRRHHNEEAAIGYRYLCLRGFVVQGSLDPKEPVLDHVFRVIDSIGWVMCSKFTPAVINRLMMMPTVKHSFEWKDVDLNQAISHLTGDQCSGWTGFNLNALINPFQALYRVCELNWLPGLDSDSMIKNRLRLLYAVAKRNKINFGLLVYDHVIEMTRKTDWDTNLIFPNLIYQLLMLQREVPLLPGDEEPIGRGLPIQGLSGDTSGPRGHRRLY
ncbi:hypothetical protein DY000_02021256 [Brassica cretica]|uniref:Putative plant transposon protein domain-containing protein n=1 Tax=Brassica cretica TaxID=69181 RepID=A0ABQ7E0J3_BRACR|nr:hypothetical protein DY000_02021256 [Brassica cretica]